MKNVFFFFLDKKKLPNIQETNKKEHSINNNFPNKKRNNPYTKPCCC